MMQTFQKDHLIEMIVATRMGQDDKVKSLIQNLKKYRYKKRKGKSGPKKRQVCLYKFTTYYKKARVLSFISVVSIFIYYIITSKGLL